LFYYDLTAYTPNDADIGFPSNIRKEAKWKAWRNTSLWENSLEKKDPGTEKGRIEAPILPR